MHYFLIGRRNCLNYRDEFVMMNALMCMVTHQTKPIVYHDIDYRVVMILLSYYVA